MNKPDINLEPAVSPALESEACPEGLVADNPPPTRFRLLGEVEAEVNGRPIDIGHARQQCVLVSLLVDANHVVSVDQLIDRVWTDKAPAQPRQALHSYVSRLRRSMGSSAVTIAHQVGGYVLAIDPMAVDLQRFYSLLNRAAGAHSEAAARLTEEALELWRGPAFGHLEGAWLDTVREDLERRRVAAELDRNDFALSLGQHHSLLADLSVSAEVRPLDERVAGQLMLALYRCGRQADALAHHQRLRTRLVEELGIDPSPPLQRLYQQILAADSALDMPVVARGDPKAEVILQVHSGHPADAERLTGSSGHRDGHIVTSSLRSGPLTTRTTSQEEEWQSDPSSMPRHDNLIGSVHRLIGREAELTEIAARVEDSRIVTIVGIGGMGKSRVALEAARSRRDADGPWLVELAHLKDGSLLAETVTTALGIPSATDAAALATVLRRRCLLLILDNCEQIIDDIAVLVTTLLERCPQVRVLATSRQTLRVAGEYVLDLRPLAQREAEELFLERASAVVPDWTPDEIERDVLTQLCDGLDNLPLAIELAAAQCRALSIQQLAEQLSDRFALLSRGHRHDTRHASMAAAVAWSYDSLTNEERELFEALCVLEGSFDLEGATAVGDGRSVLTALLSLIEKSLVIVLGGLPRRYRILETLRQFAAQHRPGRRTAAVQKQIVTWVCALAEKADIELCGPRSREWMRRLDQDKDTIRAALAWSNGELSIQLRIAVGMFWYWYRSGYTLEALRALEPLSVTGPQVPSVSITTPKSRFVESEGVWSLPGALRLRGSVNVLLLRYLAGDHEKLPLELDHVRALVASTDDEASQSEALAAIAYFEAYAGHINQALSDANSALSIAKRMGSDRHTCSALMAMAMAHLRTGDANEAVRCATESVKHADACGFAWVSVASTWINCKARIAAGDFSRTTMVGLARVVKVSATDRDVTSWLVGIVCAAYVLLKNGNSHRAAELVGIANRQGNRLGFAPEAMDPVETRQFLTEIMRCVDEQELTTAYEKGWALDARQTFSRVDELVEEALN